MCLGFPDELENSKKVLQVVSSMVSICAAFVACPHQVRHRISVWFNASPMSMHVKPTMWDFDGNLQYLLTGDLP